MTGPVRWRRRRLDLPFSRRRTPGRLPRRLRWSWAESPPLTPTAPTRTPSRSSGIPPAKMIVRPARDRVVAEELRAGLGDRRQVGGRHPVGERGERLVAGQRDPDEIRAVHPLEGDELVARIDDRARHRNAHRSRLGLDGSDHRPGGRQRQPCELRSGRAAPGIDVVEGVTGGHADCSAIMPAIPAPPLRPERRALRLSRNCPPSRIASVMRSMRAATAFVAGVTPRRIWPNT